MKVMLIELNDNLSNESVEIRLRVLNPRKEIIGTLKKFLSAREPFFISFRPTPRTADGWWICANCGHPNEKPDRACNHCFATRR